MAISATDTLLIVGYVLLIVTYAQRLHTRQSIAAVTGYSLLLLGKRLEYARGKDAPLTQTVKRAGYAALFFSPSFLHWYDALAIIGYIYCILGKFDESVPPLAIYYILGAYHTTSPLSKVARSVLGVATTLRYKSPLQ